MASLIKLVVSGLLVTSLVILVIGITHFSKSTPISPLASNQVTKPTQNSEPESFIHYGFIPFWNISQTSLIDLDPFTHLSYFSLNLDSDGSIITQITPTQSDPGWYNFSSTSTQTFLTQARNSGIQIHLSFTMASDESLITLLDSSSAQDAAIDTILELIQKHTLDGINIDFEPDSPVDISTANQFSQFISKLNQEVQKSHPAVELSIDIYPSAAKDNNLWQLESLSPSTDYFIVMTYDYYRSSSTHAGPIAPLYLEQGDKNIMHHLQQINQKIPRSQIVLGIPLYGYQWQTVSDTYFSPTYPKSGFSISLKKIQELILNQKITTNWNPETLSDWLSFTQDDNQYQIHYDSIQTIKLKVDLAKSAHLAGAAYWALGYQPNNFTQP